MDQTKQSQPGNATGLLVSVILATYNEARFIEGCLGSILSQKTILPDLASFEIEVLAVDGMSQDGTPDILNRYAETDRRVRVVQNEKRRAPYAFNLGLQYARGEYVCILGAHSVYRDDYIAICLRELIAHNAAGCGGRVMTVPASDALGARLCAWTMSHPFGSSRKSFRTQREGVVDTVNYAVFRRDLVLAAGGYDLELTRNQDNDLNQKLRAMGYILWCTWKTQCMYFPKPTVRGLLKYGFTNGFWNALSLKKNADSMAPRHFVPFVFVLCLLVSAIILALSALFPAQYALLALLPLTVLLGFHLAVGVGAALQVALRERSVGALCLPAVFLGFHFAYGYGTLSGLLSGARHK